jgi:putative lipoprotein
MTFPRSLLLTLLPIFGGCQSLPWSDEPPGQPIERLQGEVTRSEGMLLLRTCQGQRQVVLLDAGATGLPDDAQALLSDNGQPLFADVRGRLISRADGTSQLQLTQVYRLQGEGHGCDVREFNQLTLSAGGHEPGWSVRITTQGMLLERPDHAPLAVPYLEEQLPGGQTSFSSEANNQRLNLWVAPQRCIDSATGAVSHLTAELRLDDQTLRGCAYYGGARNE